MVSKKRNCANGSGVAEPWDAQWCLVGTDSQELRILRKTPSGMVTLRTLPVRFVPMTGKPAAKDSKVKEHP